MRMNGVAVGINGLLIRGYEIVLLSLHYQIVNMKTKKGEAIFKSRELIGRVVWFDAYCFSSEFVIKSLGDLIFDLLAQKSMARSPVRFI